MRSIGWEGCMKLAGCDLGEVSSFGSLFPQWLMKELGEKGSLMAVKMSPAMSLQSGSGRGDCSVNRLGK